MPAGSTKVTSTIDPENPGAVASYKRIITYGETPLQNDTTYMYQNKINPFALLYFAPIEKLKILKAQTHPSAPQTNSDPVHYTAAELQEDKLIT